MKKYFFSMIALLIFGAIVFGAGYVMYVRNDVKVFGQTLEYTDMEYAAQSEISAIDFDLVGDYNVILQRGEVGSLSYAQSEISEITVSEENGVLMLKEKIDWKKHVKKWYCKRQKTDLTLTLPEGNNISLKCNFSNIVTMALPEWEFGDIDLSISGKTEITAASVKATDVNLNISGFASVNINGEFQNVNVKTSGMSEIELNGSANAIDIKSSGTMSFDSEDLTCPQIDIKASGTAELNIAGAGDSMNAKVSGYCKVNAEKFSLNILNMDASGYANLTVNVKDEINATASGSSKVEYYGNPMIKTNSSSNKFQKLG